VVEAYVKALRAAGKQVETYEPDHGGHSFYFGNPRNPETQEATRRAVAFFKKCFGR
jgi:acetyl esterase/lipase